MMIRRFLIIATVITALLIFSAACSENERAIETRMFELEPIESYEEIPEAAETGMAETAEIKMIDLTETTEGDDLDLEGKTQITTPAVFRLNQPVAGNYPQGLYEYPFRQGTTVREPFTQTIVWEPAIARVFGTDTEYSATLTLRPNDGHTFIGTQLADVRGLPENGVVSITARTEGDSLVLTIAFHKTASESAEPQLLFYDNFEGTSLDRTKWDLCPAWDRQGGSSWRDDMVSVSDGNLHIRFRRDEQLGAQRSPNNATIANTWLRAGGIRTRPKEGTDMLFEHGFGFYEARIKFPQVRGTWGAFWLMSPSHHLNIEAQGRNGTEIDIVETISNHQDSFNAALHWNGYAEHHRSVGTGNVAGLPFNIFDGEFHVFALCWSPTEYVFFVNGVEFWRVDGGPDFRNSGVNQNPNYIKLTVERASWSPLLPADFEEGVMLVDYVRVYNQPMIN